LEVGKMCVFNGKLAIYRKRCEILPKLLVITNVAQHVVQEIHCHSTSK